MIKATRPLKGEQNWLIVPYAYAILLGALALVQLIGFGGFDFAGISFETQGTAASVIVLAAVEIFALPFLLRLNLSPLARLGSALLSMAVPLLLLAMALFMRDQAVAPITLIELVLGAMLGLLAAGSWHVLSGDKVVRLSK